MQLTLPPVIEAIAEACAARGGRALWVGGGVRDALMGRPLKDYDLEVYGLPGKQLQRVLRGFGHVNTVGRAFGVYKLRHDALEIDVSIPRRDSNAGPGHKGIAVEGDPEMSLHEATRRRDLTVNAILYDVLGHEIIDPFGGQRDLQRGLLRAVDPDTFLDDPLRALRVVQFCARLDFEVVRSLVSLCRQAPLHELPKERVFGEWEKLLLKGVAPDRGLQLAADAGILARVFPELVPAPPHLDAMATLRDTLAAPAQRLALMLIGWLHLTPASGRLACFDRLGLIRWRGVPVREQVLAVCTQLDAPVGSDPDLRWLSTRASVALCLLSRQVLRPDPGLKDVWRRAEALGVLHHKPVPLLLGRQLLARGARPGPALGRVLDQVYSAQLDGTVCSSAEAEALGLRLLRAGDGAAGTH